MRSATTAGDALTLGRDALALARVAVSAGEVDKVDEIRWPVERAIATLRTLVALSPPDAAASREVLDRLADVLAELDARTGGDAPEK